MSVVTDSKCQAELSFKCWGIINDFRAGKWWAGSSVLGRSIWCLYMLWGGRRASRGPRQQTRCVRKSLDWGGCRRGNKGANLRDFFKHRIKFEFESMERLSCLGACWCRTETATKETVREEGDDELMGHLRESAHSIFQKGYFCRWGCRGRQGGFHILRYIISFNGGILCNFYFLFVLFGIFQLIILIPCRLQESH